MKSGPPSCFRSCLIPCSLTPGSLDLKTNFVGCLNRVTHAIQAAMHQHFAIDYLNPAELVTLFLQLSLKAEEAGCNLLIQYHSDLFRDLPVVRQERQP
jgi:hypothetical protein